MFSKPSEAKRDVADSDVLTILITSGISLSTEQASLVNAHRLLKDRYISHKTVAQCELLEMAVHELNKHKMLTQEHFNAITKFPMEAFKMACSLTSLRKKGMDKPENLKLVMDQDTDVQVHLTYGALCLVNQLSKDVDFSAIMRNTKTKAVNVIQQHERLVADKKDSEITLKF